MKMVLYYSGCSNEPPRPVRQRKVSFMLTFHDLLSPRGRRWIKRFSRKRKGKAK